LTLFSVKPFQEMYFLSWYGYLFKNIRCVRTLRCKKICERLKIGGRIILKKITKPIKLRLLASEIYNFYFTLLVVSVYTMSN
jgi:hypothetical protein